jgi:hypothetical protein
MRILDRSAARGSFSNKITTQRLATIATSQDNAGACSFSPSHYCPGGLENTRFYDAGFYIYYRQGAVYDRYWREYASWTVSNENVYFVSTDGAVVALTSGNPQASDVSSLPLVEAPPPPPDPQPVATSPYTEARAWEGRMVTVTGTLRYIFNNGKYVLLGFSNPHQGSFKALIRKADWERFGGRPEERYQVGQEVRVRGVIAWYQGDPAIFVTTPEQIEVLEQVLVQEAQ